MIYKIGNGPWMITVQAPTYSYDVTISDDMANTITTMITKPVQIGSPCLHDRMYYIANQRICARCGQRTNGPMLYGIKIEEPMNKSKHKPIGWWCEECEMQFSMTPGNINRIPPAEHGWPSPIAPMGFHGCRGELIPYYTRTQVRRGFEGVMEWSRKAERDIETEGLSSEISALFTVFRCVVSRRMEEW